MKIDSFCSWVLSRETGKYKHWFHYFLFLDAVVPQLLQDACKRVGKSHLLEDIHTRCITTVYTSLLCQVRLNNWVCPHVAKTANILQNHATKPEQHFWNYLGDSCFRQVSLTRWGTQPIAHDILNALVSMHAMKTQLFFNLYGDTSELERQA